MRYLIDSRSRYTANAVPVDWIHDPVQIAMEKEVDNLINTAAANRQMTMELALDKKANQLKSLFEEEVGLSHKIVSLPIPIHFVVASVS